MNTVSIFNRRICSIYFSFLLFKMLKLLIGLMKLLNVFKSIFKRKPCVCSPTRVCDDASFFADRKTQPGASVSDVFVLSVSETFKTAF